MNRQTLFREISRFREDIVANGRPNCREYIIVLDYVDTVSA